MKRAKKNREEKKEIATDKYFPKTISRYPNF